MSDTSTDGAVSDEALQRSAVLERVTEGIVALDPDLRYTYVNDHTEKILDISRRAIAS
jgi:hypothetical protein